MFQFPGFPTYHYGFMARSMVLHHGGFPIRKSADIMLICSSPRLIAAYHVLHRLLMPRHSPYALVRLNFLYNVLTILWFSLNCLSFFELYVQDYWLSFAWKDFYSPFALVLSYFHLSVKLYHTFVCIPFSFGKTKLSLRLFVLFCSFSTQIFLLFDCQRSLQTCVCWSVWMDSNHRPRAYQARALATWATNRN